MGLGYVPTGPVPGARQGAHLPGRQHRRAGAQRALHLSRRAALGRLGERIAADLLAEHGLEVLAANVGLEGGEVDLVARDGDTRVVVEVRTVTGTHDPIDAVSTGKRRRVRRLAARSGAGRVDWVGVGLRGEGVVVHWVPGG